MRGKLGSDKISRKQDTIQQHDIFDNVWHKIPPPEKNWRKSLPHPATAFPCLGTGTPEDAAPRAKEIRRRADEIQRANQRQRRSRSRARELVFFSARHCSGNFKSKIHKPPAIINTLRFLFSYRFLAQDGSRARARADALQQSLEFHENSAKNKSTDFSDKSATICKKSLKNPDFSPTPCRIT